MYRKRKKKKKIIEPVKDIINFEHNGLIISVLVPDGKLVGMISSNPEKLTNA